MKRFFGSLLICVLLVACFGSVASVALAETNDVTLTLDVSEEDNGEILAIVTLTKNDGVVDLYLRVEYDTDALELSDRTFGKALASLKPVDNFEDGGYEPPYRVEYLDFVTDSANVTDTGMLFTLRFKVNSGVKNGNYPVKLVVRQVGFRAGDKDVDIIYNQKYGDPVEATDDVSSTTTGGVVVAQSTVSVSGGGVDSIHSVDTEEEETGGGNELMIGLIVGGVMLLVGALIVAYIVYRKRNAKKA